MKMNKVLRKNKEETVFNLDGLETCVISISFPNPADMRVKGVKA